MPMVVPGTLALCVKVELLHVKLKGIDGSRLARDNGGRHGRCGGAQGSWHTVSFCWSWGQDGLAPLAFR